MTTNPSASFFASSGSSSNSFASVGTEWTSTLRFYDYRQGNTFVVPEKYRHDDLPKLSHLIGDDIVVEMYSHTGKLFEDLYDTTSILHHAFVVFKTVNFKVNNNKQVKQVIW